MLPLINLGFVQIPTFYLVISVSITLVLILMNYELTHNSFRINRRIAYDITLVIMMAGFIGARLTHVFYEEFEFYKSFPLEVFKFWKGGFVYFGGFALAFICVLIYLKQKKETFLKWADFFTPYLSLSYALGRLGCFFEGCCYGSYCELPWAVNQQHPTQLYMLLSEAILLFSLIQIRTQLKSWFTTQGNFFLSWVIGHAACRFIIENYRADDRGQIILHLSISQWISACLMIIGLYYLIHNNNSENSK